MELFDLELTPTETADGPEPFRIDSEERAAWVVDRMLTVDEKIKRLDRQHERARAALVREREALDGLFLVPLQQWVEVNMPRKGRTIHLLTGSISFRRVKGGPRVVDSAACLAWATEALPDAVVTHVTRKVDAQAIKEHVRETGEIPPGVQIAEDAERLYVRSNGGDDA